MNSRGVILGWACGLGQAQDLLLMIFWGSGSWVLSGPPGKLQAYQVRNQINTPGGRSKKNSGFREPPHPARPNCHLSLPWDGALFFGSQAPRTGRNARVHRVTHTCVTSLFLTTSGHRQVLTSPALAPRLATGHPVSLGAVNCSLAGEGRQFSLYMPTLICWWWPLEFGADHCEILSRV